MSWRIRLLAWLVVFFVNVAALALVPLRPLPQDDGPVGKDFQNSIGMKLVRIEPGTFVMGSPPTEPGRLNTEVQHEVEITKLFYIGKYEVTQQEYEKVMGTNPSAFCRTGRDKDKVAGLDTRRHPVDGVSWEDAREFCRKLTQMERQLRTITAAMEYTLPTEAEWEYCCRAGTKTAYSCGETISHLQANITTGDVRGTCTRAVGSFQANAWGLHEMHGNVMEWCEDWYSNAYYRTSPRKDPPGPAQGQSKALRGGSWDLSSDCCRSANHDALGPKSRGNSSIGFRVVLRLQPRS